MRTNFWWFTRAIPIFGVSVSLIFVHTTRAEGFFTNANIISFALQSSVLLKNGRVLSMGGYFGGGNSTTSAHLYDPASNAPISSLNMLYLYDGGRAATTLPDGRVLIEGCNLGGIPHAELFYPDTGSFSNAPAIGLPRGGHSATLLNNGKVIVIGGSLAGSGNPVYPTSEIYDPVIGNWQVSGSLVVPRWAHTATLLPDGKVVVVGGRAGDPPTTNGWPSAFGVNLGGLVSTAEVFDPALGVWVFSTNRMSKFRAYHTATLLPNGKVLIAGGNDGSTGATASSDLYDPETKSFKPTGTMLNSRQNHTATLLPNGKVLVVGGNDNFSTSLSSSELYDPSTGSWSANGSMNYGITVGTAILLPNGKVLISGGLSYYVNNFQTLVSVPALYYPSGFSNITLTGGTTLQSGAFQFGFSGNPSGTNTVYASTNASTPATNWTSLGVVPEVSPALYIFTDPQATNSPQRFYRVRAN